MNTTVWATIGSFLAIVIGLWKYFGRKAAYRRTQADKAKEMLDDAQKNNDASGRVFAWQRINRLRKK